MYLIQKDLSGKTIENKHGRFHYSQTYGENSRPKSFLNTPIRELAREYLNLGNRGVLTVYSDGLTHARSSGRRGLPYEVGNVPPIVLSWTFADLAATPGIGDIYICGKFFKGDMCLGGYQAHEAMSTGGGNATGAYGTYEVDHDGITAGAVVTADKFNVADTGFESVGSGYICDSIALGYGYVPTTDLLLGLTNTTDAFAENKIMAGYLFVAR